MAETKTNALRKLDTAKIPYEIFTYEAGDKIDGISVANKVGLPVEEVFKTIVAVGKSGGHYVLVIPVADELDLKKCAAVCGEKAVELLNVKDLLKTTGYVRGGCSPVGMKKLFPTFIHESAASLEKITVSAGKIGLQMRLSPDALSKLINAGFADLIHQ